MLPVVPAAAQETITVAPPKGGGVAEALLTSRKLYSRDTPRCGIKGPDGEIIVCAPDGGAQWRVPGSSETDPTSRAATNDGVPRAPELGRGSCVGQFGCLTGGWAPPPAYMIDLSAIPDTPRGSDAEKVANGEMSDR